MSSPLEMDKVVQATEGVTIGLTVWRRNYVKDHQHTSVGKERDQKTSKPLECQEGSEVLQGLSRQTVRKEQ